MNSSFPDYAKPPVIELVLGVQFDPIPGFTAGHAGWFWKDHLGVEWKPSDAPLLDKQLETFGKELVPALGFQIQQAPAGTRLMIHNETSNRLVQGAEQPLSLQLAKGGRHLPPLRTGAC